MNNGEDGAQRIQDITQGKNVLFIATKNKDYLRIEQEISLLKKYANKTDVIASSSKSYPMRLLYVYWKILTYSKHFDVVFIGFSPQLILPFFLWRFRKKIIIIDFFISIYDTLIFDRKYFKDRSWASLILKNIDIFTLKVSDIIICDTNEHSKYFINELAADPTKTATLYLNADKNYYYPKNSIKPDFLKDKFTVLYFGSALPLQGIEVIIEAINKINSNNIHFLIIGPIKNDLKSNMLSNTTFINWLSQDELSTYIDISDLCLAGHFNNEIEKAKRVIPGKAYIYEAMNKRMILGDNAANRERYPKRYKNIEFVKMGSAIDLSKTIENEYIRINNAK